MSILNRLIPTGGMQQRAGGMEERTLTDSSFVPPPSTGVIDDFVGTHRAMASMTVLACVNLLADTIASLPWKAYRRDSKGIPKEVKPQPKILSQPYPGFDLFQWKWMTVASMALRGNAYSYVTSRDKLGYPTALLPLHPDIVFLERRPDLLMWFDPIYRIMGEQVPSQDMIHMRRFTMPGEPWGLSPIKQAAVAIGLALSSEEYGARYFREAANPSGVLSTDADLDEAAVKRQQKNWISSHGGRRLPAVLTNGFKWETLTIRPDESQFLECTVPGTPITMADGTRKPVEELHVGDQVMAWDGSKLVSAPVKAVGAPPLKELVRITTARGRTLTCSTDHPVLGLHRLRTPGGRPAPTDGEWIPAGDLRPGNYVRAALGEAFGGEENGHDDLSEDIAYFLGAMVGDGHIRSGSCSWTSSDDEVSDRMATAVERLGGRLRYKSRYDYEIHTGGNGRGGSPIRGILNESGLVGTHSHDKFVPEMITAGGPSAWRAFLSAYFDADGSIRPAYGKQKRAAYWSSTSRELLGGCQHLLALLGINSAIYPMSAGGPKVIKGVPTNGRPSWGLYVMGTDQLRELALALNPAHPEKCARLWDYRDGATTAPSRYRAANFEYDPVKSVEYIGSGETIGVEIDGLHTHVTGGLITHNTRQFQRSEICIMYRVPPILIGDTKETTAWGTGVEQITLGAVTYTFRAWTSCIESVISNCLPRGMFVRFDYDALMRGDVVGRWGAYTKAIGSSSGAGFITANELRAREEMDPIEGGDVLLQPSLMVPMGTTPTELAADGSPQIPSGPSGPTKVPAPPPSGLPMPPTGGGENSFRAEVRGILGADGRPIFPSSSGEEPTNGHDLVGVNGAPLQFPDD